MLTHQPPPAESVPKGPSNLQCVTDGIESAIQKAKAAAGDKHVKLGGASAGKEALRAGLVDQILVHVAPYLLGGGVRLFDDLRAGIRLEKISAADGPLATHLRYRVVRWPARQRLPVETVENVASLPLVERHACVSMSLAHVG